MKQKTNHKTGSFSDVDYWLAEWLKGDRRTSPNTQEAYRRDVRQFLDRCRKPFNQVAVADFFQFQSSLSEFQPRTQARKMAAVRSFYRYLCRREVVNLNLEQIESPKVQQSVDRDKLLTEAEVQAMIGAATNDVHRVYVRFLYLTAVRVSESLSLRWRDITPHGDGSATAYIVGKGNKHRDVFLPANLHLDLELFCKTSDLDAPVFASIKNRVQALRIVQGLAKVAKIDKKVSPHSLRHAHLSHALKNGATLAELRDQAGHSNISTTSLYLHASSERATATRLKVQ